MFFRNMEARDYPAFLKLYNDSFPENERRIYRNTEQLSDFIKNKGEKFHGFVCDDGGDVLVGFLTYWSFEGYVYVEHFAVDPAYRSKNIGSMMLHHLFDLAGQDVLIEVEPQDTDDAHRRVAFYKRNGFRLREEINYVQPPYSAGQSGVELSLMTHGDVCLHDINDLHELLAQVYNVNVG